MVSDATVEEFQEAIRVEYGRDLSQKEASEILHALMKYFDTLAQIHHRENENEDTTTIKN